MMLWRCSTTAQNLRVRSASAPIPVGGASQVQPTNLRAGSEPDLTEREPPGPSVGLNIHPGTTHTSHVHTDTFQIDFEIHQ